MLFSTFLGGTSNDRGQDIAIDDDKNVYVTGSTSFFDSGFPTTPGAYRTTAADFFITKLDPAGSNLLYSTFLGALNQGTVQGLAVTPCATNTCIAITGGTVRGHPTTANAYSRSVNGFSDAFLSVLDPSQVGSGPQLIYSTVFGGSSGDSGLAVAGGPNGNVYVTGRTTSSDFPLNHAFDTTYGPNREAFLTVFDPSQSGEDSLVYSTYIGGSLSENGTAGDGDIVVDPSGVALVTGTTISVDFPVTPEGYRVSRKETDAFFVAVDPSLPGGDSLRYGTYVGGTRPDHGTGIAAGPAGIAYITGYTLSDDLPGGDGGTAPKFGASGPGVGQDAFVVKIDWTRIGADSLIDAAYVGGTGGDFAQGIAADGFGNSFITGQTLSSDGFVPSPGAGSNDAFVARVNTVIGLPTGTTGTLSTDVLNTNFGIPPYTWALFADTPPAGLLLDGDGTLAGIPTETGTSTFTVEIVDSLATTHLQTYRKTIATGADTGDIINRKGGSVPVPGREVDYFILLRNVTDHTLSNVRLFELLEPWFTFVSSTPPPTRVDRITVPNGELPDVTFDQEIHWTIPQLNANEFKVIAYTVKLAPTIPTGTHVKGGPECLDHPDNTDCKDEVEECTDNIFGQCAPACDWTDIFLKDQECLDCIEVKREACTDFYALCTLKSTQTPSEDLTEGEESKLCYTLDDVVRGPEDPNEKNVSSPTFVPSGEVLGYTVHFENIGDIEARDVFVTDVLDTDVDLSTVRVLTPHGELIPLPIDATVTLLRDNDERWEATLDGASRTISWELLNVNLLAGAGDTLFFLVQAPVGLPSGTEIVNEATIQFEVIEPLTTGETLNIIDDIAPNCVVDPLPANTFEPEFTVSWTGADPFGEIDLYTVYVSANGGPFTPLVVTGEDTSTAFTGEVGNTYGFLCLAQDTAGNVETQEADAEATTTVESTVPNLPPDADAGTDVTAELGGAVTLDGSGSQDPDNGPDPLSFSWRFVSVPAASALVDANIAQADTAQPEFTPDVDGVYRLELTVSDGAAGNSDEVEVTIESAPLPAVSDLAARAKLSKISLTWTPVPGAVGYDIYRSTMQGGGYRRIAAGHVTDYATYLDPGRTNRVTYYYVVRTLGPNGKASSDSNEASATLMERRRRLR